MKKQTLSILTFILVFSPLTALGQTIPSTNTELSTTTTENLATSTPSSTNGSVLGLQTPAVPPLISKIKEAKELLKPIRLNYQLVPIYTKNKKTGKSVLSSYSLKLRDLFVAVLDPATNEIKITGAMQNGKTFTFPDKNFDIKLVRFNGVNSRFQVNRPVGGQILALKYLITPVESGGKAAIENAMYEAYYTPSSTFFDQPEITEYGEDYLNNVIDQVAYQLQNYPSVSQPGKTIVEAIDPSLITALVYAEHTDSGEILNSGDIGSVVNRINALFATNEGETYRYSGSSAGALGISQFIESTYKVLVDRHPNANLIRDFKPGMADHVNSIKSTYLLLDDYIHAVRERAKDTFSPGQAFDYGVAAYNGGVVRVARAVNNFGPRWNDDRASEIKGLQGRVNTMAANVEALRKKTLATKEKTARAALQKQLDNMRVNLAGLKVELTTMQNATLRDETRGYLQKIYKVIPFINFKLLASAN